MKALCEQEKNEIRELLFRCTEVLTEGFRIVLADEPEEWARLTRALGAKRLCAFVAGTLSDAYRAAFSQEFLFSERCMTFEFRYHLNAYLWARGLKRVRHVTTLLFRRDLIDRKCRSVEIDKTDVYRVAQRLAFRYFFGIRSAYKKTAADPYAKSVSGRYIRIPFYRLFSRGA